VLGKLHVALTKIASLRLGNTGTEAEVVLYNGDKLKGLTSLKSLSAKTSFGVFKIPLAQVAEVTAQRLPETAEGLLLQLSFEGDSDGTVKDSSSFGLIGTAINAGNDPHGVRGAALRLRGHGSYLELPDTSRWNLGRHEFTIDLFAKFSIVVPSDLGRPSVVFVGHDEGGGGHRKWFFAWGGGMLNFHVNSPQGPCLFLAQTPFSPVPNRWYHLAITRAENRFTIYVDGAPLGAEESFVAVPDANTPLTIGEAEDLGYIDGWLDEVRIWSRALTPAEIGASASARPQTPPPILHSP
jgi:hypothetical protein